MSSKLQLSSTWTDDDMERESRLSDPSFLFMPQHLSDRSCFFNGHPTTPPNSVGFEKRPGCCCCSERTRCTHHHDYEAITKDSTAPVWDNGLKVAQLPSFLHHAADQSCTTRTSFDSFIELNPQTRAYSNPSKRIFLSELTAKGRAQAMCSSHGEVEGFLTKTWDAHRDPSFDHNLWASAKLKSYIVAHPLYEQLLAAHVACLKVATPVDQYHSIDANLVNGQHIAAKYLVLAQNNDVSENEKDELDHFMMSYTLLLQSFKTQLQEHLSVQASEAISACWEIEQELCNLTGTSMGASSVAMMPEDENEIVDYNDLSCYASRTFKGTGLELLTHAEISLADHVRHELKRELKQTYLEKLKDVRDEILRKRRAGKLPGDTSSLLKEWWRDHAKWPYPTEEEKQILVEKTGLELKQINNWFINQRKRNWQTQPPSRFPTSFEPGYENQEVDVSLSLNADMQETPSKRYLQEGGSSSWTYRCAGEE